MTFLQDAERRAHIRRSVAFRKERRAGERKDAGVARFRADELCRVYFAAFSQQYFEPLYISAFYLPRLTAGVPDKHAGFWCVPFDEASQVTTHSSFENVPSMLVESSDAACVRFEALVPPLLQQRQGDALRKRRSLQVGRA
jgi:hypothetical protein